MGYVLVKTLYARFRYGYASRAYKLEDAAKVVETVEICEDIVRHPCLLHCGIGGVYLYDACVIAADDT